MAHVDPDRRSVRTSLSRATTYHTADSDGRSTRTLTPTKPQDSGSRFRESDSVMNPSVDDENAPTSLTGPTGEGPATPGPSTSPVTAIDHTAPVFASPVHPSSTNSPSEAAPLYSAHSALSPVVDEKHSLRDEKQSPTADSNGSASGLPPSAVGTFATGAGTSGPKAAVDSTLHSRAATAEAGLDATVMRALSKREAKDAKRMSKVLKNEAKTEQRSMQAALKELEKLQKVQRQAASAESDALRKHTKATRIESKLNAAYLKAKQKWEKADAELKSRTEALEHTRQHAKQQTELLREKTAEVDRLRAQKATDDRERQAKLTALARPSA